MYFQGIDFFFMLLKVPRKTDFQYSTENSYDFRARREKFKFPITTNFFHAFFTLKIRFWNENELNCNKSDVCNMHTDIFSRILYMKMFLLYSLKIGNKTI